MSGQSVRYLDRRTGEETKIGIDGGVPCSSTYCGISSGALGVLTSLFAMISEWRDGSQ
jgi:hypothetical protein